MTLSVNNSTSLNSVLTETSGIGQADETVQETYSLTLTNGTGANQADLQYTEVFSFGNVLNQDVNDSFIDINFGSAPNAFGDSFDAREMVEIFIRSAPENQVNLEIGGSGRDFAGLSSGTLTPGQIINVCGGGGTGLGPVVAGSGDTLRITQDQGAVTLEPLPGFPISFGGTDPRGFTFNPNDNIFYVMSDDDDSLYTYDVQTNTTVLIGQTNIESVRALAYDRNNNIFYAVTPGADNALWTIDPETAQATRVHPTNTLGASTTSPQGLAYDPNNDRLYLADATTDSLYTVNVGTGQASFVGMFNFDSTPRAMAYDPNNNVLYMSDLGFRSVVTVDTETGETVRLNDSTGLPERFLPNGIAYDSNNNVLYVINSLNETIYSVDLETGMPSPVTGVNLHQPFSMTPAGTELFILNNIGNTANPVQSTITSVDIPSGFINQSTQIIQILGEQAFDNLQSIGNIGDAELVEIAWDTTNNVLYGVGLTDDGHALYTVNTTSGATTRVNASNTLTDSDTGNYSLAWNANEEIMYGIAEGNDGLFEVNLADGTATEIRSSNFLPTVTAMAYNPQNDKLYYIFNGRLWIDNSIETPFGLQTIITRVGVINITNTAQPVLLQSMMVFNDNLYVMDTNQPDRLFLLNQNDASVEEVSNSVGARAPLSLAVNDTVINLLDGGVSATTNITSLVASPNGMTYDGARDRLLILAAQNNGIYEFDIADSTTRLLTTLSSPSSVPVSDLFVPSGLALDADNDVLYFIVRTSTPALYSAALADGSTQLIGNLSINNPQGVAYDTVNDVLYVVNSDGLHSVNTSNGSTTLIGGFDDNTSGDNTIYMIGQSNNALYTLNATTGIATRVGSAVSFGVGESIPSGLAVLGGTLYMVGVANSTLYTVDPATGIATRVGSANQFGVGEAAPTGLAALNGTLYMVGAGSGTGDSAFYTLNTATGIATRVGSANAFGVGESAPTGLTVLNGTLYMVGVTTDALYTLNITTGIATRVGSANAFGVGETAPTGLTVLNGTLYMVGNATDALYTVDPATGIATRVGSATAFGVGESNVSGLVASGNLRRPPQGLAHDPDTDTLFMVDETTLHTLDTSTGTATIARDIGVTNARSLAYDNDNQTFYVADNRTQMLVRFQSGADTLYTLAGSSDAVQIDSISWRESTETMYGISNSTGVLYTIDTTTYFAERVHASNTLGAAMPADITFVGNTLYLVENFADSDSILRTVDLTTGMSARVHATNTLGVRNVQGAGYDADNDQLQIVTPTNLYDVDRVTGTSTLRVALPEEHDIISLGWNAADGGALYAGSRRFNTVSRIEAAESSVEVYALARSAT